MKKIILLLFIFLFCFTFSSAQTFSNSISEAAGSWNGTLTKTVTVSGISNLNSGIFELVQVNLSMGDNANTRNYNTYRITLTKGTTTIDLVAVGGLPNSTIKQINPKFRFNPYLLRLFEHGGTAEPFSIGYYRSQDDFAAFNGIDPNGTWTVTITETSFATGGRFNNIDLVFKTPYTVQDYTALNSYDNCATPYCLGTAEIIVASNNGFTSQTTDMYNPNTTGCSWNAAQNNSAWFKFRAAQANASITISGITNNIQILGIDAGPDDNPCTNNDNTVLNGGCPTLVTNDTYATPQYTNGSTKNNQLNLSGLTPGKYYYFIVDGTSSAVSPFYIETLGASLDCSNCDLNPTVASNSPVCENSTLNLTCSEGVSWEWSGPNGFSSTEQNPTISNVSLLANGTYTVTITDANNCTETRTVDVQISTIVTPLFNASSPVCSGTTINALPTTSNNGIEGTWSPALNNTATTTYTFAPNTGQCAASFTFTVTVTPLITPTFSFGTSLTACQGDVSAQVLLPTLSNNSIVGTWNPSTIDFSILGETVYTFTPDAGQCATTTTFTVTVNPQTTTTFSFGNNLSLCAGAAVPNLPATSANGIQGTWNPAIVNNTASGTYTFTPDANQCATAFTYSVSITPGVIPTFGFGNNLSICAGSAVPNLPATSTNGIQGTWSPSVVDNTTNGTYTFTPNSSGSSGPNLIVNGDFSQGNSSFSSDYQFITNAGQSGVQRAYGIVSAANSWFQFFQPCVSNAPSGGNMMVVDGSTSNAGNDKVWGQTVPVLPNKTYTFSYWLQTIATPNQALIEIKINGTTLGTALAPNTNCQTTQHTYQWNSGSNTTAQIEIFDRIFAANGNDFSLDDISLIDNSPQCTAATTLTVTITPQTIPTFSFGTTLSICSGGIVPALPTSSSNSITGTWSPAIVDNANNGTYTFTPNTGQCANNNTFTVTITPQITPTFSFGNNLTICAGATTPSLPATSTNGILGTWNPAVVDNTSNGTYTFTPDANQCATAFTYSVNVTPEVIPTFGFGNSLTACQGVSVQVLLPTLSNNSISGTWDPSTIDASILGQTIYTFTPDNGQCARNSTFTVTVNPIPQFTISGGCDGNDYVLEIVQDNQNINTVDWYFNTNVIGQGNSIVIAGEGEYTAVATNAFNCDNSAQFDVTNDFCTIPKGVSANNDGDNDNFDLTNLNVDRLQIFNRWGMVVYEQKNYTDQWDGRSSDGKELPDGTYYYIIEQRSGKTFTGWVYLIR
jgi:gliding motility-associated-like protein